jgi:putative endonuclease
MPVAPAIDRRARGALVEAAAQRHLRAAGLRDVAVNSRFRAGELDLVMLDHHDIVFVEVRYRKSASHGDASASVTPGKQSRLIKAAEQWLACHPQHAQRACRFDVVSYDGLANAIRREWLRGAFEAG